MRDGQKELFSNKSNMMIQNYAWALKEKQLKIMELLCSCYMTNYYDEKKNTVTIGLSDLMREVGSTTKNVNSKEYKFFRDTMKALSDYSIIGVGYNGRERLIRLINTFEYIPESNQVRCYMSEDYRESMKLQPRGNTRIAFQTIYNMDSRYSIKLYNLLRSWQGKEMVYFDLEYLKELLNVKAKSYANFAKFRQAVLDVAVSEINEKTNLKVSYEAIYGAAKRGQKVAKIAFSIKTKSTVESIADEAAPEEPVTGKPDGFSDFEYELMLSIPEEVHKGEIERIRAILSLASRYVEPSSFLDYLDISDEQSRLEQIIAATRDASNEWSDRILLAINSYVDQDYNTRRGKIRHPNAHFQYFKVGFEGWLLDHQY